MISGCYLGIPQPMKKVATQINAGIWSYGLICPLNPLFLEDEEIQIRITWLGGDRGPVW